MGVQAPPAFPSCTCEVPLPKGPFTLMDFYQYIEWFDSENVFKHYVFHVLLNKHTNGWTLPNISPPCYVVDNNESID